MDASGTELVAEGLDADRAEADEAVVDTAAAVSESAGVVAAVPVEVSETVVTPPAAIATVKEDVAPKKIIPVEPKVADVKQAEPVKAVEPAKPVAKKEVAGGWGVQVASLGSEADATKAIKQFEKNAALRGLTGKVVKATVGGAVKYRVQFVGVASRTAAAAVCAKAKISCMPVEAK